MMNRYFSPAALLFLVLVTASIQAQSFSYSSPRNEALGGPHAALTDQLSTIFNNPAGFRGVESDLTVADLNFRLTGPLSTLLSAAQGADLVALLGQLGSTRIGVDLCGPIAFGRIKNNKAWIVFDRFDTSVFIPSLTQDAVVSARFDLGGAFGYSFGIDFLNSDNRMDFGFMTKLFFRSGMTVYRSFSDLMAAFSDISLLVSPDTLPLDMGFGAGIDLGMKYVWRDTLSFALTIRDAYTPLFMFHYNSLTDFAGGGSPAFVYSSLAPDYSFGVLYEPDFSLFRGLIGNFKLMFDYNDIFDFAFHPETARNILLHFGLGAEFTVFDILALRLGLYEGLPSLGAGLDLYFFKLNIAMFGRELSSQPGLASVYNMMLGIEFSY